MRRSLFCLLLAILSLSHYIDCADNDTENEPEKSVGTCITTWVSHDTRERGPIALLWHSSNLAHHFYYLTFDKRKGYCEVTQVEIEKPDGAEKKCQYKFHDSYKDIEITDLAVEKDKDAVVITFSTADSRPSDIDLVATLDFKTCGTSHGPMASPEEVKKKPEPAMNPTKVKTITSEAKKLKANCQLNENSTQITCSQKDWHDKVLIDNVEYGLPDYLQADWWGVHNANSGAIVVYFANCPKEHCLGYYALRLTEEGVSGDLVATQEMHLYCHDLKLMRVDFTDHRDGWTCMHVVCPEPLYWINSEILVDTIFRHRHHCLRGDIVN